MRIAKITGWVLTVVGFVPFIWILWPHIKSVIKTAIVEELRTNFEATIFFASVLILATGLSILFSELDTNKRK